jgi:hypothetical protein
MAVAEKLYHTDNPRHLRRRQREENTPKKFKVAIELLFEVRKWRSM